MAIYVKEFTKGNTSAGDDYLLYADAAHELLWTTLTTANRGVITCAPGSKAYTLAGSVYFLGSNDVWTEVV